MYLSLSYLQWKYRTVKILRNVFWYIFYLLWKFSSSSEVLYPLINQHQIEILYFLVNNVWSYSAAYFESKIVMSFWRESGLKRTVQVWLLKCIIWKSCSSKWCHNLCYVLLQWISSPLNKSFLSKIMIPISSCWDLSSFIN